MKTTNKILLTGGTLTAGADAVMNSQILPVPEAVELIVKAIIAISVLIKFFIANKKESGANNG